MSTLPPNPDLHQLKKRAKDLRQAFARGARRALARVAAVPELSATRPPDLAATAALLVVAREHGFASWMKLKQTVESARSTPAQSAAALVDAALRRDLARARALARRHAASAHADIHVALVLGDANTVAAWLGSDPAVATAVSGPRGWQPLLYVCFSGFLADPERAPGLRETARRLLASGADANAWWSTGEPGHPSQTALYGASGIANDAELTRLLLDAGANPNRPDDSESLYHCCEGQRHACLALLMGSPRIDRSWAGYCLQRVLDFEDRDGLRILLYGGADANARHPTTGETALLKAVRRPRRELEIIELLLRHGGDPAARRADGKGAYALALRAGNIAIADALAQRGAPTGLGPSDRFLAACARADLDGARAAATVLGRTALLEPDRELGDWLTHVAWYGARDAVQTALDVGIPASTTLPGAGTALHSAAFRGDLALVELLIARSAPVEVCDGQYHATPLGWAIHGSIHDDDPAPDADHAAVIARLIAAGAEVPEQAGGSDAVATVLRAHGAR
jgi:ankyrin repeat protein